MADNVTLNAGSGGATIATDDDGTAHHQYVKIEFGADNTQTKVTSAVGLPVADAGGSLTVDNAGTFAVQAAQSGTWTVQPGNTANTTAWLVKEARSATATRTQVSDSATSGTILASNANRIGATITNDSSAVLYLAYGTGPATTTDYSVTLQPSGSTLVVPAGYTGIIVGIWASDPNDGGARVTEFT